MKRSEKKILKRIDSRCCILHKSYVKINFSHIYLQGDSPFIEQDFSYFFFPFEKYNSLRFMRFFKNSDY